MKYLLTPNKIMYLNIINSEKDRKTPLDILLVEDNIVKTIAHFIAKNKNTNWLDFNNELNKGKQFFFVLRSQYAELIPSHDLKRFYLLFSNKTKNLDMDFDDSKTQSIIFKKTIPSPFLQEEKFKEQFGELPLLDKVAKTNFPKKVRLNF